MLLWPGLVDLAGSVGSFDLATLSNLAALSVAYHVPVFGFIFNGSSELSTAVATLRLPFLPLTIHSESGRYGQRD